MKIDFNVKLKTLRGHPIPVEIEQVLVDVSLLDVCVEALLCLFESERTEVGKSKYERWQLAEKLMKSVSGILDLTAEEITKLKERVGKRYGPAIVGPSYNLLEGIKVEDELKTK